MTPPPFVVHHQIAFTYAACWILSCLAETMPKPSSTTGPIYLWAFRFLHAVAGAIPRLIALALPAKYAAMFNSFMQQAGQPADAPNASAQQAPRDSSSTSI